MTNELNPAEISASNSPTVSLLDSSTKSVKKEKRTDHLFKKGQSGNPKGGGRPKGSVSLKTRLEKMLTKDKADEIVQVLLDMATVDRNIQAHKLLLELKGELIASSQSGTTHNQLTINANSYTVPVELMDRAKGYATQIVDAIEIKPNLLPENTPNPKPENAVGVVDRAREIAATLQQQPSANSDAECQEAKTMLPPLPNGECRMPETTLPPLPNAECRMPETTLPPSIASQHSQHSTSMDTQIAPTIPLLVPKCL